jgi:hypothetical protein
MTSDTDRIRYAYKTGAADEMHGDIGAWCYKGKTQSAMMLIADSLRFGLTTGVK